MSVEQLTGLLGKGDTFSQHFGVPFVDTFELLNALEARFVLGDDRA